MSRIFPLSDPAVSLNSHFLPGPDGECRQKISLRASSLKAFWGVGGGEASLSPTLAKSQESLFAGYQKIIISGLEELTKHFIRNHSECSCAFLATVSRDFAKNKAI